jgi:hypothetical protein
VAKRTPQTDAKTIWRDPEAEASALVQATGKLDVDGLFEKGRRLVADLFQGNLQKARSPKARRVALSRITQQAGADSAAQRRLAIDLYLMLDDAPAALRQAPKAHILAALRAPRRRRQSILGRAVAENWSLQRLERAIDEIPRHRGGRKRSPALVRWIQRCTRAIPNDDDMSLDGLTPDHVSQVQNHVSVLRLALGKLARSRPVPPRAAGGADERQRRARCKKQDGTIHHAGKPSSHSRG